MDSEIKQLIVTCSTPVPRDEAEEFQNRVSALFPDYEPDKDIADSWVNAYRWKPRDLRDVEREIAEICGDSKHYHDPFPENTVDDIHLLTIDDPRFPYVFALLDTVIKPEKIQKAAPSGETLHRVRTGLQTFLHTLAGGEDQREDRIMASSPSITFAVSEVPEERVDNVRALVRERREQAQQESQGVRFELEREDRLDDLIPVNLQYQGRGFPRSLLDGRFSNMVTLVGDGGGVTHTDVRNPAIHVLFYGSTYHEVYPFMPYPQPNPSQLEHGNFRWTALMLAAGAWMEPASEQIERLEKRVSAGLHKVSASWWEYLNPWWLWRMFTLGIELSSLINHVRYLRRKFGETLAAWEEGDYSGIEEIPVQSPSMFSDSEVRESGYLGRFAARFRTDLEGLSEELDKMHRGAKLAVDYVSTAVLLGFTGALVLLTIAIVFL